MADQYIGVGGIARKVKNEYVGVNGIARKTKAGYVGVDGIARKFFPGGKPIGEYAVGSIVKLLENRASVDYLVVNQGIPSNSSLYDLSCDGTWLLRQKCYSYRAWDSTDSSYGSSDVNAWLNGAYLGELGLKTAGAIKQVKIPYYNNKGGRGSIANGSSGLSTKIFLLSSCEVGFTSGWGSLSGFYIGAKLSYFTKDDDSKRKAYLGSSACDWWLRVPVENAGTSEIYAASVSEIGWLRNTGNVKYDDEIAVRPALILPKTTLFNPETNQIIE